MIRGFIRRMVQGEILAMEDRLVQRFTQTLSRNNEKVEADLLHLGLIEKSAVGSLNRHSCSS